MRRYAAAAQPPVTLKLVDWADEEGARFGHSLLGSGAAAGTLDLEEVRSLKDKQGTLLVDALKENGVELDSMLNAHAALKKINAKAYLEFHIEQGGVLESQNRSTGVVLGTFGLQRHMLRFVGQAAHAGATPINLRRDAFLAAARRIMNLPGASQDTHNGSARYATSRCPAASGDAAKKASRSHRRMLDRISTAVHFGLVNMK